MEEIWKEIEGYLGYEVSNLGRVRSYRCRSGKLKLNPKIMKPHLDRDGYAIIVLVGTPVHQKIHRIVARAFLDNPAALPQVNHINGMKNDNRVDNLEWCSLHYNVLDARKRNENWSLRGSDRTASKLTDDEVTEIYTTYYSSPTYNSEYFSTIYGVSKANINNITIGNTWGHVTSKLQVENKRVCNCCKRLMRFAKLANCKKCRKKYKLD